MTGINCYQYKILGYLSSIRIKKICVNAQYKIYYIYPEAPAQLPKKHTLYRTSTAPF
ncbi:unnamed protein product, partial [Vitis vinifera]